MGFDGGNETRDHATVAAVRDLARGLRLAADTVLVVAAAGASVMLVQLRQLSGATAGSIAGRASVASMHVAGLHGAHTVATALGWALFAALALTGALFLPWMWKARIAAADLRGDGTTHGEAWVTFGWLPLFNLAVPYALMNELFVQSDPDTPAGKVVTPHRVANRMFVALWSGPTAVLALVCDLRLVVLLRDPIRIFVPAVASATVAGAQSALAGSVALLTLVALSGAGLTMVVHTITRRLERAVAAHETVTAS